MKRIAVLLLSLLTTIGGTQLPDRPLRPTVIPIAFDGWRWDYHTRYPAPTLSRLISRGVRAQNLIPSLPSKTFPNHYTIVTRHQPDARPVSAAGQGRGRLSSAVHGPPAAEGLPSLGNTEELALPRSPADPADRRRCG